MKHRSIGLVAASLILGSQAAYSIDVAALQRQAEQMQAEYQHRIGLSNGQDVGSSNPVVIDSNSKSLPMPTGQSNLPNTQGVQTDGQQPYITIESEIQATNQANAEKRKLMGMANMKPPIKKVAPSTSIPKDATKYDLDSYLRVPVVKNTYATFQFPFNISEVQQSSDFIMRDTPENKRFQNMEQGQNDGLIEYDFNKNKIFFKAGVTGKVNLTIFGGGYPITLEILINENKGTKYAVIEDKAKKQAQDNKILAKAAKTSPLPARVVGLIAALYNNKAPMGFRTVEQRKVFYNKPLKLTFIHDRDFYSPYMLGERWIIVNQGKTQVQIYEEMFNVDNDILAVSLENDVIAPKKSANVFVIRYGAGR